VLTFEWYLVAAGLLLVLSIAASKISDRFGIPALLLFIGIGMLAGSDGPGGIYFDDPYLAQYLGTIALIVILFSGGLDTSWMSIRPVLKEGIALASLGVVGTALLLGLFAHLVLDLSLLEGVLIGAIVSSTDAAAVFAILRSKGIYLQQKLRALLELESGSNDPMAVFLTIGLAQLLLNPGRTVLSLIPLLIQQLTFGVLVGWIFARLGLFLVNRLKLGYSGLYPVLMIGLIIFVYGVTTLVGGSGFLAVYLTGLLMSQSDFLHKRGVIRFFDSLAWLMQIAMFLVLGLLVFPSRIVNYWQPALLLALFLMFVARPLSVWITLLPFRWRITEKHFVSWVGLRGAVPIILATYPRIMGLSNSELIFNVVFFVVMTSVLIQGTTIPPVAQLLKVKAPALDETRYPIELTPGIEWSGEMHELAVPADSWVVGKAIYEIHLPDPYLVILIARGKDFVIPNGGVVLEAGDKILGLAKQEYHVEVEEILRRRG
jgi:cell volume regulation protein A